ncbi:hypothetical protein CPB86DRAFT_289050 [Serendipita vermifera]|nr:hypothetical protein CPB86DRAFT_289050 [Serendipita vermifera]
MSDKASVHTAIDKSDTATLSRGKTPAAAYAELNSVASPVSPIFASSGGDSDEVIIRSSDGYDFYVNRFILKLGSPPLGGQLNRTSKKKDNGAEEDGEKGKDTPIIMLPEPACILDVLLTLIYPVESPTWTSLEGFGPVLDAAIRYDMRGAVETLRQALISPRRVDEQILPSFSELDPLRVFAIAKQAGLEQEAQLAGNATKGISLRNSEMSVEVENMPTKFYRELIHLRDDKGHWRETFKLFKQKGVALKKVGSPLTRVGSTRSTLAPSFMGRVRG